MGIWIIVLCDKEKGMVLIKSDVIENSISNMFSNSQIITSKGAEEKWKS